MARNNKKANKAANKNETAAANQSELITTIVEEEEINSGFGNYLRSGEGE